MSVSFNHCCYKPPRDDINCPCPEAQQQQQRNNRNPLGTWNMWLLLRQNMAIISTLLYIVLPSQMFNLYIKQAAEIFGVTHTREIYEKAIEVLPDEQARWGVASYADILWARHAIFLPHERDEPKECLRRRLGEELITDSWENKVMKSTLRMITFKCGIEAAI